MRHTFTVSNLVYPAVVKWRRIVENGVALLIRSIQLDVSFGVEFPNYGR